MAKKYYTSSNPMHTVLIMTGLLLLGLAEALFTKPLYAVLTLVPLLPLAFLLEDKFCIENQRLVFYHQGKADRSYLLTELTEMTIRKGFFRPYIYLRFVDERSLRLYSMAVEKLLEDLEAEKNARNADSGH